MSIKFLVIRIKENLAFYAILQQAFSLDKISKDIRFWEAYLLYR